MTPGFQVKGFKTYTEDGRNCILLNPVPYNSIAGKRYVLPRYATSDGASTPPELWITLPPFGSYWKAAYLHDCAYHNTLLWYDDGGDLVRPALCKSECDLLLKEAMQLLGTHEITATEIYEGVRLGGQSSYDGDRARGWEYFMVIPPYETLAG